MMSIFNESFLNKIKEELKLTDITKDNHNNISQQFYYLQLLFERKASLYNREEERDSIYSELYNYYKYDYNKELKNNEIDIYIKANIKWKEINEKYNKEKNQINFLEEVVKLFQNRGFAIKNAIDVEKLKN